MLASSDEISSRLKRPASSSNVIDEPPLKYSNFFSPQPMPFLPSSISEVDAMPNRLEILWQKMRQQEAEIQQLRMQQNQAALSSTTPPQRRPTLPLPTNLPHSRPNQRVGMPNIPVPTSIPFQIYNPAAFGLFPPASQFLPQPLPDIPAGSPSPARNNSIHQTTTLTVPQMIINGGPSSTSTTSYIPPCYQRADEEIYSNFIAMVRLKIRDLESETVETTS